uniref:xanthine dehydrogenase accessory protein XdhC n=1 Tax=Pararhizobium sp. IMCC3301 TaxID=3067904 RepID=UPI0027406A71|nr:xanthine dehydrogenase accessory protein XdhC [Pararhizobium sp. IMCC3301]
MKLWQPLAECLKSGQPVVLVLVQEARGSVPRGAGAGLVVLPGGDFYGTIGGGALEWQALGHAKSFSECGKNHERLQVPLGPNLGQCCGGHVSLSFELWQPDRLDEALLLAGVERAGSFQTASQIDTSGHIRRKIVETGGTEHFGIRSVPVAVFGAGHVGKALMKSLSLLPVRMTWIDSRADMFPGVVPDNISMHALADPRIILPDLDRDTAILIMTHSHAQDLSILEAALKASFSFVGVIGSRSKRSRFESMLIKSGMAPELARSFVCPIGIPGVDGKEPSIIAASVSAQVFLGKQPKT